MSLLEWTDDLSVHDDELDAEHRKLIDILNSLYDAMKSGRGNDVLGGVLAELVDYTTAHFAHEEKMLQACGYELSETHEMEHAELLEKVSDLKLQFEKGSFLLSVRVLDFLKVWVTDHIIKSDKKYSDCVRQYRLTQASAAETS